MRTPKPTRALLAALVALGGLATLSNAQSVTTAPVGAVTSTIEAGTGSSRRLSTLSLPLSMSAAITGASKGALTSVTSTSITVTGAGWQSASLSSVQTPYVLRITSGIAAGRVFAISTTTPNTTDTLTIDSTENADLVALGLASGNTFEISPIHTLASLLDTTDGVLGGASAAVADNILINKNGVWSTYFYNTGVTPNRWSRVALGSPDASNEQIKPDTVVLYSRLANSNINITTVGNVPSYGQRATPAKRSGLSFVATGWPKDITLAGLSLQTISGWTSNSSPNSADKVMVLSAGVWRTYFYDGTNWRQVALGNPIRDTDVISATSGVLLNRLGASSSVDTYIAAAPYSL